MTDTKSHAFAGFWRRLGAWIIDCILLSLVCSGGGFAAISVVAGWGSNARVVGLIAGVLYFGILSSGLGGGRTLAMRMLGLKVVTVNGKPLGLPTSLLRAIILVAPVIFNGWMFPPVAIAGIDPTVVLAVMTTVLITIVFGIGGAQVVLMLFGGPARRLVHDLATGAVVVNAETTTFDLPKAKAAGIAATFIILAALVISLPLPGVIHLKPVQNLIAELGPQTKVQTAVNALPEVAATEVTNNTTTFFGTSGQSTTHTLVVTARLHTWPADPNAELARIGAVAVKAYRFAPGQQLQVKIVYGFEMGFGAYNRSQYAPYSVTCTTADVKCLK